MAITECCGQLSTDRWAAETFGAAALKDTRRTRRLVAMAAVAALRPSGKVSSVFDHEPDREGAYDFLENKHVPPAAVAAAVFGATCTRARESGDCVFVVVDGSTLTLTDDTGAKGFGPVGGAKYHQVSGLKVMSALAVARDGVPIGLIDQIFWSRPPCEHPTKAERTKRDKDRSFEDKENFHFLEAATHSIERLAKEEVRAWVVIDREGDDRNILLGLHHAGCAFTIRGGKWDRNLWPKDTGSVDELLDREPSLGTHSLEIGRTGKRAARTARVDVRAAQVILRFPKRGKAQPEEEALRLYAVRLREEGGEGLEWLLYTNVPVLTAAHAQKIVESYQARWRIEEFHLTWKKGDCNVESAQLRSVEAMVKWATILAAIATRIERLKYLARKKPNAPASTELAPEEIEALKLDQRSRASSKRVELPDMPSIGVASRWIAQLGGWIGARNGPPGSITLSRGLERLGYLVEGIALARQPPAGGRRT